MAKAKVYLICLDAFPETPELISFMSERKLSRSELVCSGAFTCATMTSIISGKLGTEVLPGGIGYNTLYNPEFFSWRKDQSIVDRLVDMGQEVRVHNHVPWFSGVIGGKSLSKEDQNKHYRDHSASDEEKNLLVSKSKQIPFGVLKKERLIYSSTNPDLTLNTFLKWNFPDEKQKFYSNEKEYLHWLQQENFNGLFLTDLCHWHEAIYYSQGQIKNENKITREDALKDTLSWLSNWNFEEENSLFLIFADHSHQVKAHLDPQSYLTWMYYRDNVDPQQTLHPILSSNDLYPLIEQKLGLPSLSTSSWTRLPIGNYNPNRIYAIEDGRSNSVVKTEANAFARTIFQDTKIISMVELQDSVNYPAGIYLFLSSLENKYTYTVYTSFADVQEGYTITSKGPLSEVKKSSDLIYILSPQILKQAQVLLDSMNH